MTKAIENTTYIGIRTYAGVERNLLTLSVDANVSKYKKWRWQNYLLFHAHAYITNVLDTSQVIHRTNLNVNGFSSNMFGKFALCMLKYVIYKYNQVDFLGFVMLLGHVNRCGQPKKNCHATPFTLSNSVAWHLDDRVAWTSSIMKIKMRVIWKRYVTPRSQRCVITMCEYEHSV